MKISVIGLGMYSLALSKILANNANELYIWTESKDLFDEWKKTKKVSSIYDTTLQKNIKISTNLEEVINNTDIIYIVTASKYVDIISNKLKPYYKTSIPICIASKGIEETKEEILSNVVSNILNTKNIAVISGPTFAVDILNGDPVALALGSRSNKATRLVNNTLKSDKLKLRYTKDLVGIQICGAIKNVIAIAAGIIDGLGYSNSTQAFLINESLHDIKDIIYYFGGNPKTILSFAGVGDLMLTCTSTKSRNYTLGLIIGKTKDQRQIKEYLSNNTIEGYNTLNTIYKMLYKKGIEIPLINVMCNIIFNEDNPNTLIDFLLNKK